jgi:glucan biosynthesis protein C
MDTKAATRNNYLDWLRVILILTVFCFHSIRFFDTNGWEVKNGATYLGPQILMVSLTTWMMPAIFVISGASAFYALRKPGMGRFIKDKVLRLLVPLVVGDFTHAALQAYLSQLNHSEYTGSFWQWYPTYITGGHFNWTGFHLWYLVFLFVFSVLCVPLFQWLRNGSGKAILAWLGENLAKPGAIYLPMLLVILPAALINPNSGMLGDFNSYGGWNLPAYLVFFLSGFVIVSSERLQARILRLRWVSLAVALVGYLVYAGLFFVAGDLVYGTSLYAPIWILRSASAWTGTLAIIGFGMQAFTARSPFLEYANEAVLPFYVLHQSVLITIGYFMVQTAIPDLLKWVIIFVSSFAVIMGLYEGFIRRVNALRFLFGMKLTKKAEVVTAQPARA